MSKSIAVFDHKGKKYPSRAAMCRAYNITYRTYNQRIARGLDTGEALTKPSNKKNNNGIDAPNGIWYRTIEEMLKDYNISSTHFYKRLRQGCTLEAALAEVKPIRNDVNMWYYDHLGNKYNSITEMTSIYNIDRAAYYWRKKLGWSLEKTLTTPMRRRKK